MTDLLDPWGGAEHLEMPWRREALPLYGVSLTKFLLLFVFSLGLYQFYWGYRQWRSIRDAGKGVFPLVRAFFLPFFLYAQIRHTEEIFARYGHRERIGALPLALTFFLLALSIRFVPAPFDLLPFLGSAFPLLLFQQRINAFHRKIAPQVPLDHVIGFRHLALVGMGGFLLFVNYCTISDPLIRGDALSRKIHDRFLEAGYLQPQEKIIYLYADGLFSIEGRGLFFTETRLVRYLVSGEEEGPRILSLPYDDIVDLSLQGAMRPTEDSVLYVEMNSGYTYMFDLPVAQEIDKRFYRELRDAWVRARRLLPTAPSRPAHDTKHDHASPADAASTHLQFNPSDETLHDLR
ncbi:MAG: hypothetical protein D6795_13050 [Deltaproteobacteria bacterium]|nr:MAG: hypothetical protein D6795_13050 [Deltaproteobacteria bacterium]